MNPEAFQLTLEQQLQLQITRQAVASSNREQLADLLIELTHLLMVKDNVIKDLMRSKLLGFSNDT